MCILFTMGWFQTIARKGQTFLAIYFHGLDCLTNKPNTYYIGIALIFPQSILLLTMESINSKINSTNTNIPAKNI